MAHGADVSVCSRSTVGNNLGKMTASSFRVLNQILSYLRMTHCHYFKSLILLACSILSNFDSLQVTTYISSIDLGQPCLLCMALLYSARALRSRLQSYPVPASRTFSASHVALNTAQSLARENETVAVEETEDVKELDRLLKAVSECIVFYGNSLCSTQSRPLLQELGRIPTTTRAFSSGYKRRMLFSRDSSS